LEEEKKKEKLEKRNKTLTSQLSKIERDMANNNKELAKLSANISEFKANAAR
jgi:chaperonin cofactor prefoldin